MKKTICKGLRRQCEMTNIDSCNDAFSHGIV